MRPLKSRGEAEVEVLLPTKSADDAGDGEDDYSGADEVLYAVDDGPDPPERSHSSRRRRIRRREFLYTRAEERAVVRKLDKYLVGGLAVLYMLRSVRPRDPAPPPLSQGKRAHQTIVYDDVSISFLDRSSKCIDFSG